MFNLFIHTLLVDTFMIINLHFISVHVNMLSIDITLGLMSSTARLQLFKHRELLLIGKY